MQNLKLKAEEYKTRVQSLETQKQEVERQLIILEEQYKQYRDKIEQAFGTSDYTKLQEIAGGYLKEIETLEAQLNGSC